MRPCCFLILPALVTTLHAQDTSIPAAVASAQPNRYEQPACGIKPGHFRVSSGTTYLSTAIANEMNRERLLRDAVSVISQAIRENGQASNPGAWFYLGRVYLYQGDVVGADTAFSKAEGLAPQCQDEMANYRRVTAQALMTPGGLFLQAGKSDSAIVAYQLAARIYPAGSQAPYTLATVFEDAGKADSAMAYFRKAVAASSGPADRYATISRTRLAALLADAGQTDSSVLYYQQAIDAAQTANDEDARNRATFALALVLYNAQRYPDAIPILRRYVAWRPDNSGARQMLVNAFRSTGQVDSANASVRRSRGRAGHHRRGLPGQPGCLLLPGRRTTKRRPTILPPRSTAEPNNHTALRNLVLYVLPAQGRNPAGPRRRAPDRAGAASTRVPGDW